MLLLVLAASTQVARAQTYTDRATYRLAAGDEVQTTATATVITIPTVTIPQTTPLTVPTVTIPQPTATPTPRPTATPRPRPVHRQRAHHKTGAKTAQQHKTPQQQWILAYLTSYCPGSAGWVSSSGMPVFYGMLANDFYRFGTRVYIPVVGMTGIVEDRIGDFSMWNHFDVWSPICYSTPTGWYRVAIQTS